LHLGILNGDKTHPKEQGERATYQPNRQANRAGPKILNDANNCIMTIQMAA